jgi:hypothetical protein
VPKAGIGAVIAFLRTLMTGGDARLMSLVRHDFLQQLGPPSTPCKANAAQDRSGAFCDRFIDAGRWPASGHTVPLRILPELMNKMI